MNLFFYSDDSEILEAWYRNSSFQIFPSRQDRKTIHQCFWGQVRTGQFCFKVYLPLATQSCIKWPFFTETSKREVIKIRIFPYWNWTLWIKKYTLRTCLEGKKVFVYSRPGLRNQVSQFAAHLLYIHFKFRGQDLKKKNIMHLCYIKTVQYNDYNLS